MKTLDLDLIKTFFLNNWKNFAILILAILLFQQCNGNSELKLSAELHEANAKQYLLEVKAIKLDMAIQRKKYNDDICKLDFQILEKNNKIADLKKNVKTKTAQIKKYNSNDIANYLKDKYRLTNGIKTIEKANIINDSVGRLVVTDLVIGESCKFENKELKSIITIQEDKFNVANNHIDSLNVSIEAMVKNYELADSEKDKANSDLKKQIRKSNIKKGLYKYIAIGLAGFITYEKLK